MVHQFQEIVLRAEDVPVGGRGLHRPVELVQPQPGLHHAGRTAGRGDDALGMLGDQLLVHPGFAVIAVERGDAAQPEKIAQPLRVGRQHCHVGVGTTPGDVAALAVRIGVALPAVTPEDGFLVVPGLRRDIGFYTDDRFDAGLLRGLVELVGTEHVAVVGHPHRGHAQAGRFGEQQADLRRTVQHRVLGVHVQVDEGITLGHWSPFAPYGLDEDLNAWAPPPEASPCRTSSRRVGQPLSLSQFDQQSQIRTLILRIAMTRPPDAGRSKNWRWKPATPFSANHGQLRASVCAPDGQAVDSGRTVRPPSRPGPEPDPVIVGAPLGPARPLRATDRRGAR